MSLSINLSFLIPQPTGLSVYASNVLPHLQPLEPDLLVARDMAGFRCHRVPDTMTSDRGAKGHLRRLIWTQFRLPSWYRQLNSSLLFCPIPEAPLWSNCRTVVMIHDLIPLRFARRFSRLTAYFRYYIPAVARQAEHIICNSQATANDIVEFYGIPARKITPSPLACDRDRYRFLDLPTEPYFLYLGRNDPYKNLGRAIAAFGLFLKAVGDRGNWHFRVAGPANPRYQVDLVRQVQELGLEDRVQFLGYVPTEDLPILLNRATALVFPSLWEGFGFPALEAMACGTPVIASNRASIPEVTGNAALLVDPLSERAIADAMARLVREPQLAGQLRQSGLARAGQLSWQRCGRETASLLAQHC